MGAPIFMCSLLTLNINNIKRVIERAIILQCQMINFSVISWQEQVIFWWDVRFVLDQHSELDFNSARSLKRSAGRQVNKWKSRVEKDVEYEKKHQQT